MLRHPGSGFVVPREVPTFCRSSTPVQPIALTQSETVAALVRAIRRADGAPHGYGSVERFTVTDVHDFARRLVEEGVQVQDGDA